MVPFPGRRPRGPGRRRAVPVRQEMCACEPRDRRHGYGQVPVVHMVSLWVWISAGSTVGAGVWPGVEPVAAGVGLWE